MNKLILVMACYHKVEELANCLDVLMQNARAEQFDEIRIYNNGSEHEGTKVLEKYTLLMGVKEIRSVTHFGSENIGKAKAINKLVNGFKDDNGDVEPPIPDDDIICVIDSDIQVRQPGTLERLRGFIEKYPDCIIVPEHEGARAHSYKEQDVLGVMQYDPAVPHAVITVNKGNMVAGACMTLKAGLFKSLGGFDETSIYGGNEAGLWRKYSQTHPEGNICVLVDTKVFHPEEKDIGYQEFKRRCQREIRLHGKSDRGGYYEGGQIRSTIEMAREETIKKLEEANPGLAVIVEPNYSKCLDAVKNALAHETVPAVLLVGTNPQTETEQSKFKSCIGWCGESWKVVVALRAVKDVKISTTRDGCSLITKGRNKNRLPVRSDAINLNYHDLEKNRDQMLNLEAEAIPAKKKGKGKEKE